MSKNKKPTAILEMNGTFKKNPDRRPSGKEPDTEKGIGEPPVYFDDEQQQIWHEVLTDVADGVFQSSDRIALENCCLLIQQKRANPSEFMASKDKMLKDYLKSFGMTPDTRPNIVIPPKRERNPFDEFM